MSVKKRRDGPAKSPPHLGSAIRKEFALAIALGTAALFLATGSQLVEIVAHPVALIVVFLWLFAIIVWSAISVARHADCLAIKLGEPYGTLILTLSAISIEVVMVSTAMLHGENNPTLGRDSIFAVMMIALNGLVGLCLLLGGLRYREQHYNLQGVNAYLNVIMSLAVLGLVLPNFTTTTNGPTFSTEQQIFLIAMSLLLYSIFLLIQTMRHRRSFMDSSDNTAKFGSSFVSDALNGVSCDDAAVVSGCRYFSGGKVCYPIGQQHRAIWHAASLWRRNYRCSGACARGNRRHRGHFAQSAAALDKYSVRIGAGHHWAHNFRRADDWTRHETIGHTWRARRKSSAAAVNACCKRGYVYQQKNKCLAGLHSFAAVCCVRAVDFCAVSERRRTGCKPIFRTSCHYDRLLDFSVHHYRVRLFFRDLESEPLVEAQHWFASYEA